MILHSVTDQRVWDAFIAAQPRSQFTQSWAWGEFRRSLGNPVRRLAADDASGTLVAGQCIRYPKAVFKGYWYLPRGPVIRGDALERAPAVLGDFFGALNSDALGSRGFFLRCEPPIAVSDGAVFGLRTSYIIVIYKLLSLAVLMH